MTPATLVSAVIPTFRRPNLVARAVDSALAQTVCDLEVVVVVDGSDRDTLRVLRRTRDARLRVIPVPRPLGPGDSRNHGVVAARGKWIAFLDDDDWWEAEKLEHQLEKARRSALPYPIISCRLRAHCRHGRFVWPRRVPRPGELLGDYLFRRRSLFGGEGFLQTSTLFTRRELLLRVPFRTDLPRSEDLDWILRAARSGGAGVEFVEHSGPLVTWDIEDDRPRLSTDVDWRGSLDWIRANRDLVSSRAYASFLLTWVSVTAARQGRWPDFVLLWNEARRGGTPSLLDAVVHVGHWILPPTAYRRLSAMATRNAGE